MTTIKTTSHYALGSTDAEHDRLIRQAALLAPFTERFFRGAGIGTGQRVLDIGSGVGRSEEHTSELQSLTNLVCRLLLEKKKESQLKARKRCGVDVDDEPD